MPLLGVAMIEEYPFFCRRRDGKLEFVISHMADSEQKNVSYALHYHSFISFVTHNEWDGSSMAGMIRFLAIKKDSMELVCATLNFEKPFESRMTDMTKWSLHEKELK